MEKTAGVFDELKELRDANVPLINVVTFEEERTIAKVQEIWTGFEVYTWDLADDFEYCGEGKPSMPATPVPVETLLKHIAEKAPRKCVAVLKDFHLSWNNSAHRAKIIRKLRNMTGRLRANEQFLILLTPVSDLPMELRNDVAVLEVPLPRREDLTVEFDRLTGPLANDPTHRRKLPEPAVKLKLIDAALGLTTNQARLAFARVWARVRNGDYPRFDERGVKAVMTIKCQKVKESGALEFWPPDKVVADVGGLENLKDWLKVRERALYPEARDANVDFPRGVLLIGVPGTGKSLAAKMLSGLYNLPLLRLDLGAVFGSLLGESEKNIKRAIDLAETVAPCLLWIDEVEKAFAGTDPKSINAGAPTRVMGSMLTWMQEHATPVFVVGTANDVGAIPPELLARFDAMFFLDLPSEEERREIWRIHLARRAGAMARAGLDVDILARMTEGFVGREIERVVREAHFIAYADNNRKIEAGDLTAVLKNEIPLSQSHPEWVERIRKWKTEARARDASKPEAPEVDGLGAERGRRPEI